MLHTPNSAAQPHQHRLRQPTVIARIRVTAEPKSAKVEREGRHFNWATRHLASLQFFSWTEESNRCGCAEP